MDFFLIRGVGFLNFLALKNDSFGEKRQEKNTKTISKEYRRYSILKVRYSILFETVKTLRSRLSIDTMIDIHSPCRNVYFSACLL